MTTGDTMKMYRVGCDVVDVVKLFAVVELMLSNVVLVLAPVVASQRAAGPSALGVCYCEDVDGSSDGINIAPSRCRAKNCFTTSSSLYVCSNVVRWSHL